MTTPPWIEIKHHIECPLHEDRDHECLCIGSPCQCMAALTDCLCDELEAQDREHAILEKYGL